MSTNLDSSLQDIVDPWWVEDSSQVVCRGRLIWAHLPHVTHELATLEVKGRTNPTDHRHADYRIRPFDIGESRRIAQLPVAGLPHYPKEIYAVYRAKVRPAIVVGGAGGGLGSTSTGGAYWQTQSTVLVVPSYGVDRQQGGRVGFAPEFVERIRHCEYPQYFWDILPTGPPNSRSPSILRFDHIQPVGNQPGKTFSQTTFRLSDEAMGIVDDWLRWLFSGKLDPSSDLAYAISLLP